jgi:hypothetical protein
MKKEREIVTVNIISNHAVRGKPYLDIDRVINEVKSSKSISGSRS